jgi:flagellar hook-associated protein 2
VGANDTLSTVEKAINDLNWGVSATIIDDGSATNPYRLSLTAANSGTAGRVVVDAGTTNLNTYNLVNAQDAAVFVGSADSTNPLLVTSSTNQISNVVSGVSMNLVGVSASPVTLTVARDPNGITSQLSNFVTDFNQLVTAINTLTSYNSTTNQAGLLLGDSTTLSIQSEMYNMLDTVVNTGNDSVKTLADIGLTVGDGATLQFDQDTFDQAFTSDPDAVEKLFNATTTTTAANGTTTTSKLGVAYSIDTQIDDLIDAQNGMITIENQGLSSKMTAFQDQIDDLNAQLSDKRNVLQEQFNNMETVLAGLQTQQASLSSLTGITTSDSSSSKSAA